jgi:hypothetical protein
VAVTAEDFAVISEKRLIVRLIAIKDVFVSMGSIAMKEDIVLRKKIVENISLSFEIKFLIIIMLLIIAVFQIIILALVVLVIVIWVRVIAVLLLREKLHEDDTAITATHQVMPSTTF